jgi:hypothetical protein
MNHPEHWIPACGGTEVPFRARNGHQLHYLWNPSSGLHAYYDVTADRFLTNDEAHDALGV